MQNKSSQTDPFNTKRPIVYNLTFPQKLLFWPTAFALRLWYSTWKLETVPEEIESLRKIPLPYILVGWHNSSFAAPSLLKKVFPENSLDCLISASKAAAWEVEFFKGFGIRSIRGSSTRRSIQALREMYRSLDQKRIVMLSPDGPSGPVYSVQAGAVSLARKTKVPLVYFTINAKFARRLKTWDRHLFPYPFAKVTMRIGSIMPEDSIWKEDDEAVAQKLQRDLLELTEDPFNVPS